VSRALPRAAGGAAVLAALLGSSAALAQAGGAPAGDRGGAGDDNMSDAAQAQVSQRAEPSAQAPVDPLALSPEVRARIGTDADPRYPTPVGETRRRFLPYYEETRGDYRLRLLPPFFIEHTRGIATRGTAGISPTATAKEDTEALYGLLYYQRRSERIDADIVFPFAWHVRDRQNQVFVLGPLAHREAPGEHDNWVAPLFFEGSRKDSAYFHAPLLLTTTHWNEGGAFTLVGPFFRDRTKTDVDMGVAPLWFHGDNGSTDGNLRRYTVIPPLLYYHRDREIDSSQLTVVGPVITKSDTKRSIVDVAPIFFHIEGKPESGGVAESHTTVFPLFHYGTSPTQSLFVVPGYLRRVTPTADTMITPFFSRATTRAGRTHLIATGPVVPLVFDVRDWDIDLHAYAVAPFFYQSNSPRGHDFLTPLFGRFETYGVSRTYWAFPNLTVSTDLHGWETDLHPIVYVGRSDRSSHTVLAPFFWDFASPRGRTTIGFPFYWRFSDSTDDSVVQVAANTVYLQKRVPGGLDWQFHVAPLFSYGENPEGYFWNVLFGLAGYERAAQSAKIKAFWIPIEVGGGGATKQAAWAR